MHSSNNKRGALPAAAGVTLSPIGAWGAQSGAVNLYDNYVPKMSRRYSEHRALYDALQEASAQRLAASSIYESLRDWSVDYAGEERGVESLLIHGDPVFSNALLSSQGTVTLIDMRGRLGDALTLQGDAVYDLGKVYQSLDGYDFILHDLAMSDLDHAHAAELQSAFVSFVAQQYSTVRLSDVLAVTALLYFSLIALHDNAAHQVQFLARSAELAMQARESALAEVGVRGTR